MSRGLGVFLVILGLILFISSFGFLDNFTQYIELYSDILIKIFPLSLVFIGFAVLTIGWQRQILTGLALVVAFLSLMALLLTSTSINAISVSQENGNIEFTAGEIFVTWDSSKSGDDIFVVTGNEANIDFAIGKVTVELPERDVFVNIDGGIGEIVFLVPKDVKTVVKGSVGIGQIGQTKISGTEDGKYVAFINCDLGIGEIKFRMLN